MEDRFKIHLFTDVTAPDLTQKHFGVESEAELLTLFLDAGLDRLHLRRPGVSLEMTEELIKGIPKRHHARLTLHDYPELAVKYGCGFQLNARNGRCEKDISNISRSCHSLGELNKSHQRDFCTLSPIYDSISKSGYKSGFCQDDLKGENLSRAIALGGVTLGCLPELKALGFGGAALLGEVWRNPEGIVSLLKYLRMRNLPLQFITDGKTPEETLDQAKQFLSAGGKWIQVRMKDSETEEIEEVLKILHPLCRQHRATLIVDDHYELFRHCDGVHLGQDDTPIGEVRKIIPPDRIIGLTVNNPVQIAESRACFPDYYGVGPFRFTVTKKQLAPVLGVEGYNRLAPHMQRPFVAIGGVRQEDIKSLIKAGASGIAVSSLITKAENPPAVINDLLNEITETLKKREDDKG